MSLKIIGKLAKVLEVEPAELLRLPARKRAGGTTIAMWLLTSLGLYEQQKVQARQAEIESREEVRRIRELLEKTAGRGDP